MRLASTVALVTLAYPSLGSGQLLQTRPELCGTPDRIVVLPSGMSAISRPGLEVTLTFGVGKPIVRIEGAEGVDEVCPLADGRLVVFTDEMVGKSFTIVDTATSVTQDKVWAYDPVLSPDGRWVVFRKFFPRQTDLPPSDEYLRYDLSKSPAGNRGPGVSPKERENVGSPLYPTGWKNELCDNIGAKEDERHFHLSKFFWSPDSKALLFADVNQSKRSVVLILFSDRGDFRVVTAPMAENVDCASPQKRGHLADLRQVQFGPEQEDDRAIFVDFEASACVLKTVLLHSRDFLPARIESRTPDSGARKTIVIHK